MKITSEEIAKLANVSRSTVSRVINNYENVPESTREKVLEVINKYGYVPNSSARVLAGKSNNIIGLFICDINSENNKWSGTNSPYFSELISQVISESKKYNHMVLVYVITKIDEYEQIESLFRNRTICGGIFVGFEYGCNEINELIEKNYNMVLVDQLNNDERTKDIKIVNSKNRAGAYLATKYLIAKGHKHIAHISGDNRLSSFEREKGYKDAMKDSNLEIYDNYIVKGFYNELMAYEKTKDLISNNKEITAIFVANDIMAIGVVRAIREMQLNVPQDISIIGFDNNEFSKYIDVGLTTMEVSLEDIASKSVKLLLSEDNENNYYECNATLIERSSVRDLG